MHWASIGGQHLSSTATRDRDTGVVSKSLIVAHVACGALATMLFLPFGILTARWCRAVSIRARLWFPVHSSSNGIIALSLIVTAFAIARSSFPGNFSDSHRVGELAHQKILLNASHHSDLALHCFPWSYSQQFSAALHTGAGLDGKIIKRFIIVGVSLTSYTWPLG